MVLAMVFTMVFRTSLFVAVLHAAAEQKEGTGAVLDDAVEETLSLETADSEKKEIAGGFLDHAATIEAGPPQAEHLHHHKAKHHRDHAATMEAGPPQAEHLHHKTSQSPREPHGRLPGKVDPGLKERRQAMARPVSSRQRWTAAGAAGSHTPIRKQSHPFVEASKQTSGSKGAGPGRSIPPPVASSPVRDGPTTTEQGAVHALTSMHKRVAAQTTKPSSVKPTQPQVEGQAHHQLRPPQPHGHLVPRSHSHYPRPQDLRAKYPLACFLTLSVIGIVVLVAAFVVVDQTFGLNIIKKKLTPKLKSLPCLFGRTSPKSEAGDDDTAEGR